MVWYSWFCTFSHRDRGIEGAIEEERSSSSGNDEKRPLVNKKKKGYNAINGKLPIVETPRPGISWYSVAFGLANASIGVGILNYPFLYERVGGIEVATFLQIVSVASFSWKVLIAHAFFLVFNIDSLALFASNFSLVLS